MEELGSVMGSVARLVAMVGGGLSAIAVCYAGILWMTSGGDPQKAGQARLALMGAIAGLVIVGIAFIVPRIISQAVIEPVGGVALGSDVGLNCDAVLRSQMVFQRGASTEANMAVVIRQIQAQRQECPPDVWNPQVDDGGYQATAAVPDDPLTTGVDESRPATDGCFGTGTGNQGVNAKIGASVVPRSLRDGNEDAGAVRNTSGRDSDNNIVVYWGNANFRPSDSAACWLYVSRLRTWSENY